MRVRVLKRSYPPPLSGFVNGSVACTIKHVSVQKAVVSVSVSVSAILNTAVLVRSLLIRISVCTNQAFFPVKGAHYMTEILSVITLPYRANID